MVIEDFSKIAKKIEELLKKRIVDEGLVKTGRLLNSIKVTYNNSGEFFVEAEDYFYFLDQKHNLSTPVLESEIIKDMIADAIINSIEKND